MGMGSHGFGLSTVLQLSVFLIVIISGQISQPVPGELIGSSGVIEVSPPVITAVGPVPSVEVELVPAQLEAEVSPSKEGAVTFDGTVNMEQAMFVTSDITLQSRVNAGWPTVISPQVLEITGTGSDDFQVTVIVPPGTSSLMTGMLRVTASAKAPGLAPTTGEGTALVTVSQYFKIRIETEERHIELRKGEGTQHEIRLYNEGNGLSSFWIDVESPKGIAAVASSNKLDILQDEGESISVKIDVGDGVAPGTYPIDVHVETRSDDEGPMVGESITIYVFVPSIIERAGVIGLVGIVLCIAIGVTVVVILSKTGRIKMPFIKPKKGAGGGEGSLTETSSEG
jgi:hypothetical protein